MGTTGIRKARNDYIGDGGVVYTPDSIVSRLRWAYANEDAEMAVALAQHAADAIEMLIAAVLDDPHGKVSAPLASLIERARTAAVMDEDWGGKLPDEEGYADEDD